MSFREFLDSADVKWAWYRWTALIGATLVATTAIFTASVLKSPAEPVVDVPKENLWSSTPNGGLVAVEQTLQWGDVWEGNWLDWPDVTLTIPTDIDLHLTLDHEACPLHAPRELMIPAGKQVRLDIFSSHPGRMSAESREVIVDFAMPFSFKIAEFPGKHPGWFIRARIQRAVAVEQIRPDRTYRVWPLRPISGVSAEIDGKTSGLHVTGPGVDGSYLVQIDQKLHSGTDSGATTSSSRRLDIHANVDGVNSTSSQVWVDL